MKKLIADDSASILKSFRREINVLHQLSHDKHIVQFYGKCLDQGNTMLVLEYMEVCCSQQGFVPVSALPILPHAVIALSFVGLKTLQDCTGNNMATNIKALSLCCSLEVLVQTTFVGQRCMHADVWRRRSAAAIVVLSALTGHALCKDQKGCLMTKSLPACLG